MVDSYLTSYETEQKDFENIPRICIGKSLKLFDCALFNDRAFSRRVLRFDSALSH